MSIITLPIQPVPQNEPDRSVYIEKYLRSIREDLLNTTSSRIVWAKIAASSVTKIVGTSPDAVADLQTLGDGNTYTITEINNNPGIDLRVSFTNVTAFNWVRLLASYQGNSAHKVAVQLEITPFDGSAWHTLNTCDHHATTGLEDYSFFVPDDSLYINNNEGVEMRFNHDMNGSPGHVLVIDESSLYE